MKTRDKVVVVWFSLLYVVIWAFSLANLFHVHFWDKRYALSMIQTSVSEGGMDKGFGQIGKTYYSSLRYIWFLPHVLGAIFWWNLYFLQLIPAVRHWKGKKLHRILGRFLMVVLLAQNLTGFFLASTSHSNIITMVSYVLNVAAIFCIFQAWRYAYWRDIPQHKYWVLRLVGYMHTISLQRFFLVLLIISHSMGWEGFYPQLDETASDEEWISLVKEMFDDSFVLCILFAILSTEWYLACEEGKLAAPINNRKEVTTNTNGGTTETSSLVSASPYGSI